MTTVKEQATRELDFKVWRDKMKNIIESGSSGICSDSSSSGREYKDGRSSSSESLKKLMRNLHDVMEMSVETNIQLTNSINNLAFMQQKLVEDCIRFHDSILVHFDNFGKTLKEGVKDKETSVDESTIQVIQETVDAEKNQEEDQPPSSTRSLSHSSKSSDRYYEYIDPSVEERSSPLSFLEVDAADIEKCKECGVFVSHSVAECPYNVNYNKIQSLKEEKNVSSSNGKKRRNDSVDGEPKMKNAKKGVSRWELKV